MNNLIHEILHEQHNRFKAVLPIAHMHKEIKMNRIWIAQKVSLFSRYLLTCFLMFATGFAIAANGATETIDAGLQAATKIAFGNRSGALVALNPNNGDVLAMVSVTDKSNKSPSSRIKNLAIEGIYAPGATIKPFLALAALEKGVITTEDEIADRGFYQYGEYRYIDPSSVSHGNVNLYRSLVEHCDVFYFRLAERMGIDSIHSFLSEFGFGEKTEVDLQNEDDGVLPSPTWKEKRFKQQWFTGDTIATGIGEGYISATPMQLVSAVAMLANGGNMYQPRLTKSFDEKDNSTEHQAEGNRALTEKHVVAVRNAMIAATRLGEANSSFADANYLVAGMAGSMPLFSVSKDNIHIECLKRHSLFIGYAPADKPTIALAVVVENGGFGYQSAAPIARAVFDYYLQHIDTTKPVPELPVQTNVQTKD